jgi:hypothetical protein
MIAPGDSLKISVRIDANLTITDEVVMTYFDIERCLFMTCGHCFPRNAQLKNKRSKLLSTSGFDEVGSEREVAHLKIWNCLEFTNLIDNIPVRCDGSIPIGCTVILRRNTCKITGVHLGNFSSMHSPIGYQDKEWFLDCPELRLSAPFVVVVGSHSCTGKNACLPTRHGFSGCPWLLRCDEDWLLVGGHVARATMLSHAGEKCEVSLTVPTHRLMEAI